MDAQNKAQITTILRGLGSNFRFWTIQKRKHKSDNSPYYVVSVKQCIPVADNMNGCNYSRLSTEVYARIDTEYKALNINIPLIVKDT